MATTTNFGITLLEPAQAQKEVTINEAFEDITNVIRQRPLYVSLLNGQDWPNMPNVLTEIFGNANRRTKVDLSLFTQFRLVLNVNVAGAASSKIRAQYSLDQVTWNYLDHTSAPSVDIDSTGLKVSAWGTLNASALADVYLRLVGLNGDGAADPDFQHTALEFR